MMDIELNTIACFCLYILDCFVVAYITAGVFYDVTDVLKMYSDQQKYFDFKNRRCPNQTACGDFNNVRTQICMNFDQIGVNTLDLGPSKLSLFSVRI